MKDYKKPLIIIDLVEINDVVLSSGEVKNDGTLDSFNPDEVWTIFDGGKD